MACHTVSAVRLPPDVMLKLSTEAEDSFGKTLMVQEVVAPKVLAPPPRSAQKSSGLSSSLAVTKWPFAVTTSTLRTWENLVSIQFTPISLVQINAHLVSAES